MKKINVILLIIGLLIFSGCSLGENKQENINEYNIQKNSNNISLINKNCESIENKSKYQYLTENGDLIGYEKFLEENVVIFKELQTEYVGNSLVISMEKEHYNIENGIYLACKYNGKMYDTLDDMAWYYIGFNVENLDELRNLNNLIENESIVEYVILESIFEYDPSIPQDEPSISENP